MFKLIHEQIGIGRMHSCTHGCTSDLKLPNSVLKVKLLHVKIKLVRLTMKAVVRFGFLIEEQF